MTNNVTVSSVSAAWAFVPRLISGSVSRDAFRSERAGYDVYTADDDSRVYVCDLGDRLEVNLSDGSSVNVWIAEDPAPAPAASPAPASVPACLAGHDAHGVKIAVYVPSTFRVNEAINPAPYVQRLARKFSAMFGGCSASRVSGYWVSDDTGELIEEAPVIVYSFTDRVTAEAYIADVVALAVDLREELQQEAISLEYDGSLYFI